MMISPTQTMEHTTEVEYISIYDKPKRGRGRPKTCKLSDEEKNREIAKQINVAITITIVYLDLLDISGYLHLLLPICRIA